MIISPNMLKTVEISKDLFKEKYIDRIPEIKLSEPFKQGKEIHALANYFLNGQNTEKLEKALNSTEKIFWEKLKSNKFLQMQCIKCEYSLSAKINEFRIGGRIDALVRKENDYYILDYKTGKIPNNATYDYQTAVYLYCVDKFLKDYNSLNFVYIGLKEGQEEKITFNNELKKEYETKLLNGCLQIKSLL